MTAQMYAVVRHGTRHPTTKRSIETAKLKSQLVHQLPLAEEVSCPHCNQQYSTDNDLSSEGMKEQFCLANRLKTMYPKLLNQHYSDQIYHFQSSQTSRSFKRLATNHFIIFTFLFLKDAECIVACIGLKY